MPATAGYGLERDLAAAGARCAAGVAEVSRVLGGAGHRLRGNREAWISAPPGGLTALEQLPRRPDAVLLDGTHDFVGHPWPVRCAVQAGLRSVSVAAASVIVKVHRDRYMAGLGPAEFGFAGNAGYPSPAHVGALAVHGRTPHHRLSWCYLDDLPQWSHLRVRRPGIEGQLPLL